jgi:16S rRNA (cytosine967-C5)-methyltransferase
MTNKGGKPKIRGGSGDARKAALEVLFEWSKRGGTVDRILWKKCGLLTDTRDQSLVRTMIYGVLQQRAALDYILEQFARQPLPRYKRIVRYALRIGLYQLLYLDRVPAHAAIHETVAALKNCGQPPQIAGLVNGVLRNILRSKEQGDWHPLSSAPPEVRLNHPAWLVDRWLQRYGEQETERLCRSNNSPPPLVLRVNTRKIDLDSYLSLLRAAGIEAEKGKFAPEAVRLLESGGGPERLPGFQEGYFQVQDEGAQLISYLLGPLMTGRCLDACAGLGGKTSHLAQLLPAATRLEAVEPSAERRRLFKENMRRLGLPEVPLFAGTLQQLAERQEERDAYQAILLDAPCSGLGVIRRHPEIRWNRRPQDLEKYQLQQLELLRIGASLLAPAGVLVYATCSTEPEENEEVVRAFLAETKGFVLDNAARVLPGPARGLVTGIGCFQTTPGLQETDGFFGARLMREKA